jgi:hypothetical protein
MADDPGGDVQQPVAQRLGLGDHQRASQQQRLGPAGEVLGGQDQFEPDGVAAPPEVLPSTESRGHQRPTMTPLERTVLCQASQPTRDRDIAHAGSGPHADLSSCVDGWAGSDSLSGMS